MTAAEAFHAQRSVGAVSLRMGAGGIIRRRESGAAKVRMPPAENLAMLINTGGGLAGGDDFQFDITAEEGARLAVTGQAAERVYRSLGPAATVRVELTAGAGADLMWLPLESILFNGAALHRRLEAELAPSARLLAVESVVFGRTEMGEAMNLVDFRDRWRIRRGGKLIFADDIALAGPPPASKATLAGAKAMATILLVSDDCERHLQAVRDAFGDRGGASAWDGKLVARVLATDGFSLRKSLIPALAALAGPQGLPKVWSF